MQVAIVDRNAATRRVLAYNLEIEGHHSRVHSDVQSLSDASTPELDVLILDLNMPGDSAFGLLKNRPVCLQSADVPGVSNCPLESDRARAVVIGVNRYMVAPYPLTELPDWIATVEAARKAGFSSRFPADPDSRTRLAT